MGDFKDVLGFMIIQRLSNCCFKPKILRGVIVNPKTSLKILRILIQKIRAYSSVQFSAKTEQQHPPSPFDPP